MRETRTPPSECLSCGTKLDAMRSAYDNATPRPGRTITMCIVCGHLMMVETDLTLR